MEVKAWGVFRGVDPLSRPQGWVS